MAWKRIRHPSEMVNVGDEVDVRVLKFDREKNRVSLGMKQLGEDPWVDIIRRYPEGARVTATVTNLTDYGCFAEIESGVEVWCTCLKWIGPTRTFTPLRCISRRRNRSDGFGHRRRSSSYLAGYQAMSTQPMGRVQRQPR